MIVLDASVTVEPSNGGLSINNVDVTLRASVDGIDEERFSTIAQKAKDTCPVSRALAGTTITLQVWGEPPPVDLPGNGNDNSGPGSGGGNGNSGSGSGDGEGD